MFYSFCGKPLPEQIFSEVYMSSQACIICTHDNSSMTNTCSFPRCWGLSLDFALQHIWPTYQRPQISRESVKKTPDFYSKAAHSAPVFRNSYTQLPRAMRRSDQFSQSVRHNPQEGHDKQSGASKSAENMITIQSRENNLMLQSNLHQPLQMHTHTSKHAHKHIRLNTNTYSLCMYISLSR